MSKKFFNTKSMVLLGLLTAIVAVFSFTPIGSIPIGPLVITLNVIPVAIGAVASRTGRRSYNWRNIRAF